MLTLLVSTQIDESWETSQAALTRACLSCIKQRETALQSLWKADQDAQRERRELTEAPTWHCSASEPNPIALTQHFLLEEREKLGRDKEDALNRNRNETKREVARLEQESRHAQTNSVTPAPLPSQH